MIFFRDTWCKVWETTPKEKYVDVKISTSEKDSREQGKYINSSWFGRCIGKAASQIKNMDTSNKVKIKTGKVTNESYTDKEGNKKSFPRVIIIEFDTDGASTPAQHSKPVEENITSESDEDYPF